MRRLLLSTGYMFLFACGMFSLSCDRPTEPPLPNGAPDTRLANIPKENDTVFALVTLVWNAGDYDGYITHYQYRYFTDHQAPGSSTLWVPYDSTAWTDTTGTGAIIAFNSTEVLNKQRFLVRAIDNDGNVDPTPAERVIYTLRTVAPISTILYPADNATLLVNSHQTDWWPGVPLTFNAKDPSKGGKIVEYAWRADGGPWHWQTDTSVFVTPADFSSPLAGRHVLYVTARNNTNLTDPVGDSAVVTLVIPSFSKRILIIDETDEFNNPFITMGISDATTDAFYADVFPGSESWDFKTKGMPPRDILAQYKLIVWHADDLPASLPHKISDPNNIRVLTDYLDVGGKFMMSGWRILKSFAYYNNFPFAFTPGTFVYDYLHIKSVTETDILGDMTGGFGKPGEFTSFAVDSARLALFPYDGRLSQVNLILTMAGFTNILYSYVNADNSPNVTYRGRAIALRYYGTVYDAMVLGFPLYFVRKDDAIVMASEILKSVNVQ
jgi:hypothetical protein